MKGSRSKSSTASSKRYPTQPDGIATWLKEGQGSEPDRLWLDGPCPALTFFRVPVSPIKIQIPGAQVEAYEKMKSAAETIIKVPYFFSSGLPPTPAPAKTNNQHDCQTPPMINGHRRENRPMTQIPKNCECHKGSQSLARGSGCAAIRSGEDSQCRQTRRCAKDAQTNRQHGHQAAIPRHGNSR